MSERMMLWSFSPLSGPSFRGRIRGSDLPGAAPLGGGGRDIHGFHARSASVSTRILRLLRILATHRRRRRRRE
jgi:hypothetical protein